MQNPLALIHGFAGGGSADSVPALLTPGEFVINAPRAADLGPSFLHALNNMQFSRGDLEAIVTPPAPRRPVQYFAEGGMVGDSWTGKGMKGGSTGGGVTLNVYVDGKDLLSTDNIRRKFLPVLNDINRRSRK